MRGVRHGISKLPADMGIASNPQYQAETFSYLEDGDSLWERGIFRKTSTHYTHNSKERVNIYLERQHPHRYFALHRHRGSSEKGPVAAIRRQKNTRSHLQMSANSKGKNENGLCMQNWPLHLQMTQQVWC